MDFKHTQVLATIKAYHPHIYREVIVIQKHKNNMNRKEGTVSISNAWLPAIKNMRIWNSENMQNDRQGELASSLLRTLTEHTDNPLGQWSPDCGS